MGTRVDEVLARLPLERAFEPLDLGAVRGEWARFPCPLHGGRALNLAVNRRSGAWTCHSRGCHGDDRVAAGPLAWIAYTRGFAPAGSALRGSAFKRALAEAAALAGYGAGKPIPPVIVRAPELESEEAEAARVNRALALWGASLPLDGAHGGALAYLYGRGLPYDGGARWRWTRWLPHGRALRRKRRGRWRTRPRTRLGRCGPSSSKR